MCRPFWSHDNNRSLRAGHCVNYDMPFNIAKVFCNAIEDDKVTTRSSTASSTQQDNESIS